MKIGIITEGIEVYHKEAFEKFDAQLIKIDNSMLLDEVCGLVLCVDNLDNIKEILIKLNVYEKINKIVKDYFPIMAISSAVALLAKDYEDKNIFPGLLDIKVEIENINKHKELSLDIPVLGLHPFKGVFYKNINILNISPNIGILCQVADEVVFIRQGNILAATFHPELANDYRIHRLFLQIIKNNS